MIYIVFIYLTPKKSEYKRTTISGIQISKSTITECVGQLIRNCYNLISRFEFEFLEM